MSFWVLFWTLGANPGVPWRPKADHWILRVYLEAVTPHNSTFEPHFEAFHYLEWIRNVKITQIYSQRTPEEPPNDPQVHPNFLC